MNSAEDEISLKAYEYIAGLFPYPMAYHPGSTYRIDQFDFITSLKALYSHWNEHKSDLWSSSDVLAIATPPPSDDLLYLKSSALHIWLFGYVFPETIMVFMQKQIHFLCSQKKASMLDAAKAPAKDVMGVEVVMHVKAKNDDGSALMETIFRAIHAQSKVDGADSPVVGYIAREAPEGKLLEKWAEKLKNVNFQLGDVTNGLSDLLPVKGKEELVNVEKAAFLTTNVMNHIVVIDEKNEETGAGDSCVAARTLTDPVAYKNVNDLPPPKDLIIQIDRKNEAVLLPIHGSMVPFHISTISGVSSLLDVDRSCFIRILFNVPGTPLCPHDANSLKFQGSIYLAHISFLYSKDWRSACMLVQMIRTFQRQFLARESKRVKRATLVTQERLQLAGQNFKPIRLSDLQIRPPFGGRGIKMPGTLEAHVNGFRFSTTRQDEGVDIIFGNIKHAFFQPAENEMITLLHFHLHNYINLGNKITKDVQFYVEVIDVVQTLGGGKRSAYDSDEIEEGQRETDRKSKINMDFQSFVHQVNDLWRQPQFNGLDLEFDQPLRELGFHGVPYKSSAFIVPTSTCLVQLIETPFLVVTLGEIEIVNLERVGLKHNNFDMAIVFKDFRKGVLRIDSIPSTARDGIKDWLDTTDFKYYESRMNRNWRHILDSIIFDEGDFIDDGGWEFLKLDANDSESEPGYGPSDLDPLSDLEDYDTYSESLVESEEEDGNDSGDSEVEKGKTWEELGRQVTNADREKGAESDSEEDRKRRMMKAFGKSRASPTSSVSKLAKLRLM